MWKGCIPVLCGRNIKTGRGPHERSHETFLYTQHKFRCRQEYPNYLQMTAVTTRKRCACSRPAPLMFEKVVIWDPNMKKQEKFGRFLLSLKEIAGIILRHKKAPTG